MQEPETVDVVVVGAGVAGLTLAAGVRRRGYRAVVVERDARPEDTGGYRLHLHPPAVGVLRRALTADDVDDILASSADASTMRRFSFLDPALRVVFSAELAREERDGAAAIGRVALRCLLARAAGPVVRWGRTVARWNPDDLGARVELDDGTVLRARLLVGADGARSRIAATLAGEEVSRELRVRGLAARAPWNHAWAERLAPEVQGGAAFAVGPRRGLLFVNPHRPRPEASRRPGATVENATLLWGLTVPARHVRDADASAAARAVAARWSPLLAEVVAATDPADVTLYRYRAARRVRARAAAPRGAVIAIGDAVHAMPPTGGRGASTALLDVGTVLDQLDVLVGDDALARDRALAQIHRAVVDRGLRAVRASMWPLRVRPLLVGPVVAVVRGLAGLRGRRNRLRGPSLRG